MTPAFAVNPAIATRHEEQLGILIRKAARAEGHMKALPPSHDVNIGRHDGNCATAEESWNARVQSVLSVLSENGEMTRAQICASFPNYTVNNVEKWVGAAWRRGVITARFIKIDGKNFKMYRVAD